MGSNYPNRFLETVTIGGIPILQTHSGEVFFVNNSGVVAKNGKGASDGNKGTYTQPFSTLDYAIGRCTASRGDIIIVMPGHNESLTAADAIDVDVAGITIIGLGTGSLRPTFDYDNAAGEFVIGANNVTLKNLVLRPSVTSVLIGVDIETGITGTVLEDIEFAIGEDGAGTDEFVKALHLTSGNHDTVFRNLKILAHASASQATHGIHVDAASDRLTFDNVVIDGPYATNGILEDAAGVNHIVVDCSVDVTGTNYGFHASSTFAKRVNNLAAGVIEDAGANLIGVNDADNNADTSSVVANENGSVLERLEQIQEATNIGTGTSLGANSSLVDAVGFNGVVALTVTAGSLYGASGAEFIVKKALTSSAVVTGGVDVTGTATGGDIMIEDIIFETDGTGLAAGTNFTIEKNGGSGVLTFFSETVANLGANKTEVLSTGSVVASNGTVLESGQKLVAKCTGSSCTGSGVITAYIKCKRVAAGATLAAA